MNRWVRSRLTFSWLSLLENDEVDVNWGVDLEHGDVLDGWRWAVDIDDSLVDSHLISVPGVGSLTTWRFSGGNSQDLGWNSDWTSGLVSLVLGSNEDFVASPLEWLSFSSLKCHSIVKIKQLDQFLELLTRRCGPWVLRDSYLILWMSSYCSTASFFSLSVSIFNISTNSSL